MTAAELIAKFEGYSSGAQWNLASALAPVALSTVVTGGAVHVGVYCNGTNWIVQ